MRTHSNVRDDRPFSGPVKTYVAPFKGLKGGRNNFHSVTYRSNFFQDDLDDPELAFDNNNTFSYPDEPIYSELVFKSPQHPNGPSERGPSEQMSQLTGSPPKCPERVKPPYPSPPSYKSHPCYNKKVDNGPMGFQPGMTNDYHGGYNVTQGVSLPPRQQHSPHEEPEHSPVDHHGLHGYPPEFQFYDWEAVNLNTRNHKPDLSSDSDYFSTSTTYRANDNYKGMFKFL